MTDEFEIKEFAEVECIRCKRFFFMEKAEYQAVAYDLYGVSCKDCRGGEK